MSTESVALAQTVVLSAQTLVLAATGYLVWRYTKATENYTAETAALRAETVRQNKLSLRPIVLPEFPMVQGELGFQLRNCGLGCAVNVQVAPIETNRYAGGEIDLGRIESGFEQVDYLSSGERADVRVGVYANGQPLGETLVRYWFHPRQRGPQTAIEIFFADVEGNRYRLQATVASESDLARLPRKVRIGSVEELGR